MILLEILGLFFMHNLCNFKGMIFGKSVILQGCTWVVLLSFVFCVFFFRILCLKDFQMLTCFQTDRQQATTTKLIITNCDISTDQSRPFAQSGNLWFSNILHVQAAWIVNVKSDNLTLNLNGIHLLSSPHNSRPVKWVQLLLWLSQSCF